MIEKGFNEGKITPAQKKWAVTLGRKDIKQLQAYLESAPVVAKLGQSHKQSPIGSSIPANYNEIAKVVGIDASEITAYFNKIR